MEPTTIEEYLSAINIQLQRIETLLARLVIALVRDPRAEAPVSKRDRSLDVKEPPANQASSR